MEAFDVLLTAVHRHYIANGLDAVATLVTGPMPEPVNAKDSAGDRICRISIASAAPRRSMNPTRGRVADEMVFRFELYTKADSPAALLQAGEALRAAFDYAELAIAGWKTINCLRDESGVEPDPDQGWLEFISYGVRLEEI